MSDQSGRSAFDSITFDSISARNVAQLVHNTCLDISVSLYNFFNTIQILINYTHNYVSAVIYAYNYSQLDIPKHIRSILI